MVGEAGLRTAKWPVRTDDSLSCQELTVEMEFAANAARSLMAHLVQRCETIFPRRKEPWYQANDEEVPK